MKEKSEEVIEMKMKKLIKAVALAVCLTITAPVVATSVGIETVEAATKVKLNCTKKTIYEGDSFKLKVTGTNKKVKWSSSNKKVATVSSKGSVKGISKGTCKITAAVSGKKYACKVAVKEAEKIEDKNNTADDNNVKPTKSVSENISDLKLYINSNGYLNNNGNRAIRYASSGSVCVIAYEQEADILEFIISDGGDTIISMKLISLNNDINLDAEFIYVNGLASFVAYGLVNPNTYSIYSNQNNRVIFSSDAGVLNSNWQEICNLSLEQGFLGWELALHYNNIPITLEDIGFTALYEN